MNLSDNSPDERFQLNKFATKVDLPSAELKRSVASINAMSSQLQSTKQIEGGPGIVMAVTSSSQPLLNPDS